MPNFRDDERYYNLGPSGAGLDVDVVAMASALTADYTFDPYAKSLFMVPTTAGTLIMRCVGGTADVTLNVPSGSVLVLPVGVDTIRMTSTFRGEVWGIL